MGLAGWVAASAGAAELICFEAESADALTAPMRRVDTAQPPPEAKVIAGAAGGQYIEIPEGAGKPPEVGGDATFTFDVAKAGQYVLWCRVWWLDGCGNSFGMSIDDAKEFTFGQDGTHGKWHWVQAPKGLSQLELKPGRHQLKVTNREDGVILDQILFVNHKRYVPVGIETVTAPK
jgi:hypothetical protein